MGIATETRASEAVTVAWTLAMLATVLADAAALGLWVLGLAWPTTKAASGTAWLFLPLLALFTAAITGLVCLILTPLVYRARLTPPPPAITLAAVLASAMPLGVMVAILMR